MNADGRIRAHRTASHAREDPQRDGSERRVEPLQYVPPFHHHPGTHARRRDRAMPGCRDESNPGHLQGDILLGLQRRTASYLYAIVGGRMDTPTRFKKTSFRLCAKQRSQRRRLILTRRGCLTNFSLRIFWRFLLTDGSPLPILPVLHDTPDAAPSRLLRG